MQMLQIGYYPCSYGTVSEEEWRRLVSLTLVYWRCQHKCCVRGGKDTRRKENVRGLQTLHRTSMADS